MEAFAFSLQAGLQSLPDPKVIPNLLVIRKVILGEKVGVFFALDG